MPFTENLTSFADSATVAVINSSYPISDTLASQIENALSESGRTMLARRRVYNHLVANNVMLPDGTPISNVPVGSVPWANIIQLLIQLLPTFIPLICPPTPTPTPSLPASGGS